MVSISHTVAAQCTVSETVLWFPSSTFVDYAVKCAKLPKKPECLELTSAKKRNRIEVLTRKQGCRGDSSGVPLFSDVICLRFL